MALPPKPPASPNYPPEQKASAVAAATAIAIGLVPDSWVGQESKTQILAFTGTYVISSQLSMSWLRNGRLKHGKGEPSWLDRDADGHTDLLPVAFAITATLAALLLAALILTFATDIL